MNRASAYKRVGETVSFSFFLLFVECVKHGASDMKRWPQTFLLSFKSLFHQIFPHDYSAGTPLVWKLFHLFFFPTSFSFLLLLRLLLLSIPLFLLLLFFSFFLRLLLLSIPLYFFLFSIFSYLYQTAVRIEIKGGFQILLLWALRANNSINIV